MDPGDAAGRFALISDGAVEGLRRLIGVPIVDTVEPWCHCVTIEQEAHNQHGELSATGTAIVRLPTLASR